MRRDALRAAADFITRLPALATATGAATVITCGRILVEPGGANVVPRLATLSLDFRDPSHDTLDLLRQRMVDEAHGVASAHGVDVDWRAQPIVPPVPMDESIRATIAAASDALSLRRIDLPSGAGHDAQNMAHLAPTAMIFVPSKNGRSHSPAEHSDFAAIERGANILLATLIRLASSQWCASKIGLKPASDLAAAARQDARTHRTDDQWKPDERDPARSFAEIATSPITSGILIHQTGSDGDITQVPILSFIPQPTHPSTGACWAEVMYFSGHTELPLAAVISFTPDPTVHERWNTAFAPPSH